MTYVSNDIIALLIIAFLNTTLISPVYRTAAQYLNRNKGAEKSFLFVVRKRSGVAWEVKCHVQVAPALDVQVNQ